MELLGKKKKKPKPEHIIMSVYKSKGFLHLDTVCGFVSFIKNTEISEII